MVDFLRPAGLAVGEDSGSLEVFEILVVCEDVEGLGEAFEIVSPELDGRDDGEEFLVMDFVVAFSRCHFA